MTTRTLTHTSPRIFQTLWSVPALSAGIAVLLFVAATLIPVGVLAVLVALHAVVCVLHPAYRSQDHRLFTLVQESALLLFAAACGLFLDTHTPWLRAASQQRFVVVTLLMLCLVVLPKLQVLRLLTHTARHRLSPGIAGGMMIVSFLLIALFCGLLWNEPVVLVESVRRMIIGHL